MCGGGVGLVWIFERPVGGVGWCGIYECPNGDVGLVWV